MGRGNQSPKQRAPVAPQNSDLSPQKIILKEKHFSIFSRTLELKDRKLDRGVRISMFSYLRGVKYNKIFSRILDYRIIFFDYPRFYPPQHSCFKGSVVKSHKLSCVIYKFILVIKILTSAIKFFAKMSYGDSAPIWNVRLFVERLIAEYIHRSSSKMWTNTL